MTKSSLTVAQFLDLHIAMCGRTHQAIATDCGFTNPRIIEMFRTGATKVPINIAGQLAIAIGKDPAVLLDLAMSEYMPGAWAAMKDIFPALRGGLGVSGGAG